MKQQHNRKALSRKIGTVKKQAKFAGSFLDEIKKIEWVSKHDLKKYIKVVLISIFGFGFAIYFVDLVLRKSITCLDGITTFLFG
ncbi:SecE [Chlamydia pneumoniae TW-183]|uniref:Protein translocase subunit SecE n=2 Tax=Chlamydia pneumoniae TaxID=83558 RepID=Q9Z9A6_CHLPN|nr:preprotein translocase subunit SecE [Chlamydia pneumoniae]AAD18228.1 preprotein translocase [Chlamydia pneumoniae CWL029]AAF38508.1 preprotein translocase SecE subunit, putative [Chlamydia pneumoniae AR39]AAP98008.1 SecE [Chlamydia pneumoniae TW-183]ACZ33052.1 preprotein translocase, SecE subunit [Chlamydia pneumoniae LPCoLN]ETR79956.1 Preprotein translocase subunit SecE [Chlamydia pneumoniae B21]